MNYQELGLVYLLAVMSLGPSLVVILKNSINYSWKHGVFTSLGTVFGICLQSALVLISFSFVAKYHDLYAFIGVILSFYLFYLGVKYLFCLLKTEPQKDVLPCSQSNVSKRTLFDMWKEGFLVDARNPIALSFFLVIFSTYVNSDGLKWANFLCWIEIVILGFLWYVGFSLLISVNLVQEIIFVKLGTILNFLMCFVMMFLAFKIFNQHLYQVLKIISSV